MIRIYHSCSCLGRHETVYPYVRSAQRHVTNLHPRCFYILLTRYNTTLCKYNKPTPTSQAQLSHDRDARACSSSLSLSSEVGEVDKLHERDASILISTLSAGYPLENLELSLCLWISSSVCSSLPAGLMDVDHRATGRRSLPVSASSSSSVSFRLWEVE